MIVWAWLFITLLGWHFIADYPLQGDFLAKAKNRFAPIMHVPWYQALGAHALIHGVGVAIITRSLTLGLIEAIAHMVIDDQKCRGNLTYNQDQAWHIGCKLVYVVVLAWGWDLP